MARSRNIKPSIMANEQLAELPPIARLLFIYLWMLADREGRLEDRPKRIGALALPYDREADVDQLLEQLADAGFITRYQAGRMAIIQINAFTKHQKPHVRELASELPGPDQSTTQAVPKHDLGSAEASPRSPDSLLPLTDSLFPCSDADASVVASKLDDSDEQLAAGVPDCPQQELLALYSEILPAFPRPRVWDGQRANNMKARWRWALTAKSGKGIKYATDKVSAIDFFRRYFSYVSDSDFLTGRDGKWTACSLSWLVKAENFAKVLEGQYENRRDAAA